MVPLTASVVRASGSKTVICDDLSGACEIASVLHELGRRAVVVLDQPCADDAINVVDLGLRGLGAEAVHEAVAVAVSAWNVAYIKVDSLVRGPIAAIVAGCHLDPRQVLVCTALPAGGRTIVDGAPLLDGRPLSESDAWALERTPPPTSLAELLAPLATMRITSGPETHELPRLPSATGVELSRLDAVLCADAHTDADLDRLAAVVRRHDLLPVGSAGLFEALARASAADAFSGCPERAVDDRESIGPVGSRGVVVAVGTASVRADAQITELRRAGAHVVTLDPDVENRISHTALQVIADGGTVLMHWNRDRKVDPERAAVMTHQLTELVTGAVAAHTDVGLVLTGGQTARSVLERLGETMLRPASVAHRGALVATTNSGRRVAVRPGSFGDVMSLVRLKNEVGLEEGKR